MDPLTALGLAGNILSFIDFSQKFLGATIKIYKEADEMTYDHRGKKGNQGRNKPAWNKRLLLESQLHDFIIITSKVSSKPQGPIRAETTTAAGDQQPCENRPPSSGAADTIDPPPPPKFELNSAVLDYNLTCLVGHSEFIIRHPGRSIESQDPIERVASACHGIAKDMLDRLEGMKKSGKGKLWTSMKLALQEVWHQESEVEELRERLSGYQRQLGLHLAVSIREQLSHLTLLANRQADQFNTYNTSVRDHLEQLIQEHMVRLPGPGDTKVTNLSPDVRNEIVGAVKDALRSRNLPALDYASLNSSSAVLLGATSLSSNLLSSDKRVLESLRDPILSAREREVLKAYHHTFDWVFQVQQREDEKKWDSFLEWLSGNTGSMYWIAGKAGSGKSTLMKFLCEDPRTRTSLSRWADSQPLIIASFFFWNSGNQMQRTQQGMLRELIYKVLVEHRELIPVVLPEVKASDQELEHDVWKFSRLEEIFHRLIRQTVVPLRICFFIDGLDEHDGQDEGIALLVKQIASVEGIKVCASSRQHRDFERTFKRDPSLRLQDLTVNDIKSYVDGHFNDRQSRSAVALQRIDTGQRQRLSSKIVKKADGVFLWVRIVVGTLLRDLEQGKSGPNLEERLEELPDELEDLYMHMLKNVKDPRHRADGTKLLQIVHRAEQPFTILQLAFADRLLEAPEIATKLARKLVPWTKEIQRQMCDDIELKLKSRCLGLIEAAPAAASNFIGVSSRAVQFMHQSVADFLETADAREHLLESLNGQPFGPYSTLMQSSLLVLQHQPTDMLPARQPYGYLAQAWYTDSWLYINNFARYAREAAKINGEPHVDLIKNLDVVAGKLATNFLKYESSASSGAKVHWSEKIRDKNGILRPYCEYGSLVSFAFKSGLYLYLQATLGASSVFSATKTLTSKQAKYAVKAEEEEPLFCPVDNLDQSQLRQSIRNKLQLFSKRSRVSRKLRLVFGPGTDLDLADEQDVLF